MKNLKGLTGSTKPLYPEVKGITGLSTGLKGITGIPIIRIKKKVYIHYIYQFGWVRISFYRLGYRFTLRIELSRGW